MKRTDLPIRLQNLLTRIPYVTIATVCPNGQPWNSPVVGKFDQDMNLYWASWKGNQHSMNVAHDSRIFVVIYDSQVPEGQGEGLYLQMRAQELASPEELRQAYKIYETSFFTHKGCESHFQGDCPQRIYKAVPEHIWYNIDGEEKKHFVDKRLELTQKNATRGNVS